MRRKFKKLDLVIIKGTVSGLCPKCSGPYTGLMDADSEEVLLDCSKCGHVVEYKYRWPDELPKVTLRYRSSGQLISGLRVKPRKKKLKKDHVLKGQLSFVGVLDDKDFQRK